jgi:hypothetical protein
MKAHHETVVTLPDQYRIIYYNIAWILIAASFHFTLNNLSQCHLNWVGYRVSPYGAVFTYITKEIAKETSDMALKVDF